MLNVCYKSFLCVTTISSLTKVNSFTLIFALFNICHIQIRAYLQILEKSTFNKGQDNKLIRKSIIIKDLWMSNLCDTYIIISLHHNSDKPTAVWHRGMRTQSAKLHFSFITDAGLDSLFFLFSLQIVKPTRLYLFVCLFVLSGWCCCLCVALRARVTAKQQHG